MARKIEDVEGIGAAYAEKLNTAGIKTDADMLERGGTVRGRTELAMKTGISMALILKWVNHVDLMRISGVGPQYAELLEACGVDTVRELARRNVMNLTARLAEVNAQKNLAGTSPASSQVTAWIDEAKGLPPKIFY